MIVIRPAVTVAWAITPSQTEAECYYWSSSLGVSGTWRPFGLAELKANRPDRRATDSWRLQGEDLGPGAWRLTRDWWEEVYEDLGDPLRVQVWASAIVDNLTELCIVHDRWREQSYFPFPAAVTAGGVRALGREIREQWVAYGPSLAPICDGLAIAD